jgi:predicted 3-demethylubiquinone-9 3-methyltransferase (glyoxalase superfamily)
LQKLIHSSMKVQKIYPFLWYDHQAQEAAKFYTSIFPNSRIVQLHPMVTTFELDGTQMMAMNAGPKFPHTEAFSLLIQCDTQEEIDHYWDALIADGGSPSMCGWLKDRFGLSWQVVPSNIGSLMSGPDEEASQRAFQALMGMQKIELAEMQRAYQNP